MTKQEILEAINSTIATNGVKGITAESLANILTEMVNATPEGGSGGGGGSTEVLKLSNYEATSECIIISTNEEDAAHNAEVFSKYVAAVKNGSPMNLLIDVTKSIGVHLFQLADTDSHIITPTDVLYMAEIGIVGVFCFAMGTTPVNFEMGNDGNISFEIQYEE